MQQDLTCNQVGALLSFYIEDKLNDTLKSYVQHHLEICPKCREKYLKLKKMVNDFVDTKELRTSNEPQFESPFMSKQYEDFKLNLSAYVDNELSDEESIRIKKIAISNPLARKDLEDMYTFKKLLHTSFERTKTDIKEDFTKEVLSMIANGKERPKIDPFIKIMTIFAAMFVFIIIGLVTLLI